MNSNKLHIIGVVGVTVLFAVFTLMHQYDWLIPPSPVAPIATSSAVPFPDAVEEHGAEDDLEHELSKLFYIPKESEIKKVYMITGDLFIPQISTPPPDVKV
jgi:hypothetical protein